MRKISTFAFTALLVMGFAASALAEGMCSGYSVHTAEGPSGPQTVAEVPTPKTTKPGG